MHGIKRTNLSQDELILKGQKEEIKKKQYLDLWNSLISTRDKHSPDDLNRMAELLVINPENYTVWNMRKELINEMTRPFNTEFVKQELVVTAGAIIENPKAYSPWYHRKWFIEQYCSSIDQSTNSTENNNDGSQAQRTMLREELELCNQFLDKDCRNFHCWNYRSFIVNYLINYKDEEIKGEEFNYSYLKLTQNFSNYSAWHYRTKLLFQVQLTESISKRLLDELELVRDAYYTQPKDQSAWMYALWVVGQLKESLERDEFMGIIRNELNHLNVLQDIEEGKSKWPLFVSTLLMNEYDKMAGSVECNSIAKDHEFLSDKIEGKFSRAIKENLNKLSELDPLRKGFYLDALNSNSLCCLFE